MPFTLLNALNILLEFTLSSFYRCRNPNKEQNDLPKVTGVVSDDGAQTQAQVLWFQSQGSLNHHTMCQTETHIVRPCLLMLIF